MKNIVPPALGLFLVTSSLQAAIFHVDSSLPSSGDGTSWSSAFTGIQQAVTAAGSGDHIWVAEGIYKSGTERSDRISLNAGVKIYGGFPEGGGDGTFDARNQDPYSNQTVISGDIDSDGTLSGNSFNLIDALTADSTSLLDGFTLTGANAEGDTNADRGGAVTLGNRSPHLANLRFLENRAKYGGAIHAGGSSFTALNCFFEGNIADIPGGSGGAIYITNGSTPSITQCSFSGNTSLLGGAIRAFSSTPLITNCSFAGNHGEDTGGYHVSGSGAPILKNCILWANTSNTAPNSNINNFNLGAGSTSNIIEGVTFGSGILYRGDPLFVYQPITVDGDWTTPDDNFYGDLRLRHGSSAVDQGSNAANHETADALDQPRLIDGDINGMETIDLGPFESAPPNISPAGEVHRWTFDGDTSDTFGDLELAINGGAFIRDGALILNGTDAYAISPTPNHTTLGERTFIAWVAPTHLDQSGGGILTISQLDISTEYFDGIVFGERAYRQWMNGSSGFARTVANNGGPPESATITDQVMIAIVYGPGDTITIYRNGTLYSTSGATTGSLRTYTQGSSHFLIGQRHLTTSNPGRFFAGIIDEARIYNRPLSASDISALAIAGPTPDITSSPYSGETQNLTRGAVTRQSATVPVTYPDRTDAGIVIDGLTTPGNRNAATPTPAEPTPWVEVELATNALIDTVEIENLTNTLGSTCCYARLRDITIELRDATGNVVATSPLLNPENLGFTFPNGPRKISHQFDSQVPARIIRITRTPDPDLSGSGGKGSPVAHEAGYLEFSELRVLGVSATEQPPVIPFSATYDSRRTNPDPVAQHWFDTETSELSDNIPADGFVNAPGNVGIVIEGTEVAWQVNDQLSDSNLNNPWNRNLLDASELQQLYDLGWKFTATVRARSDHSDGAYSGYVGWGFTSAQNPGWDIGANTAARVGFAIGRNSSNNSTFIIPSNEPQLNLAADSADDYITITALCPPRSTIYEWFVDDVSQGMLDFAAVNVGGLTENTLAFGSGRSSPSGGVTNWKTISLSTVPPPSRPPSEGLVFYLPFDPGSNGTGFLLEKSQAPGKKPHVTSRSPSSGQVIPLQPGKVGTAAEFGTGQQSDETFLDASEALSELSNLDSVTISLWVKPRMSGGNGSLLTFYDSENLGFSSDLRINGTNLWFYTRANGTMFGDAFDIDVPNIRDGGWHHLALSITPASAQLFYDGQIITEADANNITRFTRALPSIDRFQIGIYNHPAFPAETSGMYVGKMDEVAIWNRGLSPAEVTSLYHLGYLGAPVTRDQDKDGFNSLEEASLGTSDLSLDSDGDGITDADEITQGTNPAKTDTDGDGLSDSEEINHGSNPRLADTDGDGFDDHLEARQGILSNQGITATDAEVVLRFSLLGAGENLRIETSENLQTFAPHPDANILHLGEGRHVAIFTPPTGHQFFRVISDDGVLSNVLNASSYPAIPILDSDLDGLLDPAEITLGTNPLKTDTDDDTYSDFSEILMGSDPLDPASTPSPADTDGDGLTDTQEHQLGTDPLLANSDGDEFSDLDEINAGSDPNSSSSVPGSAILQTKSFIREANGAITLDFDVSGDATNLRLQTSEDLINFTDLPTAVLTDLGNASYRLQATPPSSHQFFRAAGDSAGETVTTRSSNFSLTGDSIISAAEGDTFSQSIVFESFFTGTVTYELSGIRPDGSALPSRMGVIEVNGARSVELPLTFFNDLAWGAPARYTVTLLDSPGLAPGLAASFTVVVEDDDSRWLGTLQTRTETLDIVIESLSDGATTLQRLESLRDSGLLPRGTFPVSARFSDESFSASASNIRLTRVGDEVSAPPSHIHTISLTASTSEPDQQITPTTIQGIFTLSLAPAIGTASSASGEFRLLKEPPPVPTAELNLNTSPE